MRALGLLGVIEAPFFGAILKTVLHQRSSTRKSSSELRKCSEISGNSTTKIRNGVVRPAMRAVTTIMKGFTGPGPVDAVTISYNERLTRTSPPGVWK